MGGFAISISRGAFMNDCGPDELNNKAEMHYVWSESISVKRIPEGIRSRTNRKRKRISRMGSSDVSDVLFTVALFHMCRTSGENPGGWSLLATSTLDGIGRRQKRC